MTKLNSMPIMMFVIILTALYILVLNKPHKKVKSVRFVEKDVIVQERPAPAHMQDDPNERIW